MNANLKFVSVFVAWSLAISVSMKPMPCQAEAGGTRANASGLQTTTALRIYQVTLNLSL